MALGLFFIPFVGVFLVWLCLYLFLVILFHPVEPFCLGILRLQGRLPRHRKWIVEKIAEEAAAFVDLKQVIDGKLNDLDLEEELNPIIEQQLDRLVLALMQQIPMAAMFLSPPLILQLKTIAKGEMIGMVPLLKEKLAEKILNTVDVKKIIQENMTEQATLRVIRLLEEKITSKFLGLSAYLAVALYLIGLFQVVLTYTHLTGT